MNGMKTQPTSTIRHIFRKFHWVLHNQVDQRVDTVRVKWRGAHEEFVDDDSERPQVNGGGVWKLLDELWSHVERGPLDRSQDDGVGGHRASETEVTELNDAVG